MQVKQAMIAYPRGFCAGVSRAVEAVEVALKKYPLPIYCFHEIVHNKQVVDRLTERGVVFVQRLDDVPQGCVLLFSAHGVTPALRAAAQDRHLTVIDATCPFVAKVHAEVRRYAREGFSIILIGKRGHEEVVGVAGEAPDSVTVVENAGEAEGVTVADPSRVAVVMQTTLSQMEAGAILDVLHARFPELTTPARCDICYATTNRQEAVRQLAGRVEMVLVLGARNSANSNRLVQVARQVGTRAALIPDLEGLSALDLERVERVGVTAGASTPESFLETVMGRLEQRGFAAVSLPPVTEESVEFELPLPLRD